MKRTVTLLQSTKNDRGIIYIATVIMVLVLFSLMTYTMSTIISINSEKTSNLYIDTEAELCAIAGVEYAFYQLVNDFTNWSGTSGSINFGKGAFQVVVYDTDENGNNLNSDIKRIIVTSVVEKSIKKIQVTFSSLGEPFSFSMYIKELQDPIKNHYIEIGTNNNLKGDMYFGDNVNVKTPRSRIDTTSVYVPPGHVVTSSATFDETYSWDIYPPPLPTFPVFDHTFHDSLLSIAEAITSTNGNEIFGNLIVNSAWDLSAYDSNTVFINGNLTVTGASAIISSFTTDSPAFIIVDGTVDFKNGCSVGDNVITIASGSVNVISTGTLYGLDWSATPLGDRPSRVNEIYSFGDIDISGGKVFSNVNAIGDLSLRGTIYASCYCVGTVEIESAIFEGAVVATNLKLDRITNSELLFIPPLPGSATGGLKPTIVAGSWKVL